MAVFNDCFAQSTEGYQELRYQKYIVAIMIRIAIITIVIMISGM
jgi:hypothetical protein